jgi:hypothetical protein
VLGFGSAAGYDATLNDKVLNLAAIDVVDKLTPEVLARIDAIALPLAA